MKADAMIYDENRDSEPGAAKEIVGTWIFAIVIVALVMIALGVFN